MDEDFNPDLNYWLMVDGSLGPSLVTGQQILDAMAANVPASYWPQADGPFARP